MRAFLAVLVLCLLSTCAHRGTGGNVRPAAPSTNPAVEAAAGREIVRRRESLRRADAHLRRGDAHRAADAPDQAVESYQKGLEAVP